jgi:hypothetical protein
MIFLLFEIENWNDKDCQIMSNLIKYVFYIYIYIVFLKQVFSLKYAVVISIWWIHF